MDFEEHKEEELAGTPMVSILYSHHRDVYTIRSTGAGFWLSVQVFAEQDQRALMFAPTADGRAYRRMYRDWTIIRPGVIVTLPANDPLVVDFLRQVKAQEL